jgi:uncharacterized protein (DUF736 family)
MAVIGSFIATKDGGWSGAMRTLSVDVKLKLLPNEKNDSERAPDFRIFAGRSEIGAAWKEQSSGDPSRSYLSLKLDDPGWPEPISAYLFETADGREAQLVWNRR